MPRYNPKDLEPKWQAFWLDKKTFKAEMKEGVPKFYCLDMFPYPSAAGLHVGHPEGYTATDIVCRYKRMRGFNVLHPMGWDAFGLPAEQHAIKTGTHPAVTTRNNIDNFRRQIQALGFSYDWDREFSTTDPGYVKWTQWIFKLLFESWYDEEADKARPIAELPIPAGLDEASAREYRDSRRLAYIAEMPVWWCQELGTVLANEEVIDGKSERGSFPCERRPLRQWMLRITAFAERLIGDLDALDWPESIKIMQRNWIGRSTGAEVVFALQGLEESLTVFTTRPDTLYGATFMVVAPEHPILDRLAPSDKREEVEAYRRQAAAKSELERGMDKEKTGVFTGGYAVNPVTGKPIPVYTADYVMMGYGTGAIMAVPAHDERDYAFAKTYSLPIVQVIAGGDVSEAAHTGNGALMNSGFLDGLEVDAAKSAMIRHLEEKGIGKARVQYKLRDWLFSRQRYWGEPFPILHREGAGPEAVSDADLPVRLPELADYQPTGTFDPPLSKSPEWANPTPGLRRELNTMPQWAGSSWYFLRYLDPKNESEPFSSAAEKYWMPVDLYIGGAEHAVLHLLYARFWHKVLFDYGKVSQPEPFQRLVNQGLILGEDGEKMSKSRGNVVNPDDVIERYGADAMRLYEMFMGPLERMKPWQTAGIEGLWRFLNRAWRAAGLEEDAPSYSDEDLPDGLRRSVNKAVRKVTEDIDGLRFNTAISAMMVFAGELIAAQENGRRVHRQAAEALVLLLSPFAPHIAEEMWSRLGHVESLAYAPWPTWDPAWVEDDSAEVVFQVNGKIRAKVNLAKGMSKEELQTAAEANDRVQAQLEGFSVVKVVVVPDRLVNFVVKPAGK